MASCKLRKDLLKYSFQKCRYLEFTQKRVLLNFSKTVSPIKMRLVLYFVFRYSIYENAIFI